jgi:transcriptional regulator with XRE-family HTH domain
MPRLVKDAWPEDLPQEPPAREDIDRYIGYQLATQRTTQNRTRREVAHSAGVSLSHYTAYERGTRSVSVATLCRLAVALDVPLVRLLPVSPHLRGIACALERLAPGDQESLVRRAWRLCGGVGAPGILTHPLPHSEAAEGEGLTGGGYCGMV